MDQEPPAAGYPRETTTWDGMRYFELRPPTRAELWTNRAFTAAAIVFSAAFWLALVYGLWRALAGA